MYNEILKKLTFFNLLSQEEIEQINNSCQINTLSINNILFYEGDFAESFYFLLEGNLKLYKTGVLGNEIVIHNLTEPTILAEMATFKNITFPVTAISTSEITKVALINNKVFLSLLQKNKSLSFYIIGSLVDKIELLEQTIYKKLIYNAIQKVCILLKENPEILITEKHSEVGNILNIAPETLSRNIRKLRNKGYLNKDNIVIDNSFEEFLI